jgi:glutamyl-tRNA synthetase
MAETDDEARRFENEGRKAVLRLKIPREGTLVLNDLVRGHVEFEWAREQDHVVQRNDLSCLYHLASVVDDHDFEITHVIRSEEHLSNTPRQVFIAQSLGYPLPEFAHLPYVAEPGSKNKLSKRKLDKYLKNRDFAQVHEHGMAIAKAIGLETAAETFNPVIVDFYEQVGYLPEAILNYLLLLGWSLDDKTELFTRDEMIRSFSLERVNKAPASFDPQKLVSFQDRYMRVLPPKQKTPLMLAFLKKAGLVSDPPPCEVGPKLARVIDACGDRVKTAGDILEYGGFFFADPLEYDEQAFDKQIRAPGAADLLGKFREQLVAVEPFDAPTLEKLLHDFVAAQGIKNGQIVHPLRVAVTGKSIGPGLFDTLAILGREACLARIDAVLSRLQ